MSLREPIMNLLRRPGKQIKPNDTDAFIQNLRAHNIVRDLEKLPDGTRPGPLDSILDIRELLAHPRAFLRVYSNADLEQFKREVQSPDSTTDLRAIVTSALEGDEADHMSTNVPFTNLDHLTDGKLAPANPDLCHGTRSYLVHHLVRKRFSSVIVPFNRDNAPIAPNFFLEIQDTQGSPDASVARIEYDLVLGTRAFWALETYETHDDDSIYDNKSRAIGFCFSRDGNLAVFVTHYAAPSVRGGKPIFVTTFVQNWNMFRDTNHFLQARTAYLNAKDYTKRQRDLTLLVANLRAEKDEKEMASA
ncbi:hypothetical protein ACHAQJ_002515 [Trichoderma viride]